MLREVSDALVDSEPMEPNVERDLPWEALADDEEDDERAALWLAAEKSDELEVIREMSFDEAEAPTLEPLDV